MVWKVSGLGIYIALVNWSHSSNSRFKSIEYESGTGKSLECIFNAIYYVKYNIRYKTGWMKIVFPSTNKTFSPLSLCRNESTYIISLNEDNQEMVKCQQNLYVVNTITRYGADLVEIRMCPSEFLSFWLYHRKTGWING